MRAKHLCLWSLALPLAAACNQPAIQQSAATVRAIQKDMLALPVVDSEPRVSPSASQGILKLKDSIARLAGAYMSCQQQPTPAQIVHGLTALVPPGPSPENKFGSPLSFEASQTGRLIGVTATFGVNCGMDTILLIFAPRENSWQQVLRWQSPPYKEVSGAFWSLKYQISPPDLSGNWFVLTSRVMPWCSSTWSSIEYAILRPGPKVLLKRTESMWWGGEDFGTLSVTANSAELVYTDRSIDGGVHSRPHIRHYEISGDTVKRTQPVAESPRDFVDEWIVSPWTEARDWSAPGLEPFHARAKKTASEFISIQTCPDAVQIGVTDIESEKIPLYFRVTGQTTFKMQSVRTTPDPACSGPNTWNPGQDDR